MGTGAPCFTVFVASIVLSAPCGMILFEDAGTEKNKLTEVLVKCYSVNQGVFEKPLLNCSSSKYTASF